MKEVLKKKGKGTRPFLALNKMDTLYSFMPAFDDLIDLETGECNFDSKEFKEILELWNAGRNFFKIEGKGRCLGVYPYADDERADLYRELVNRTRKTSIYNAPIVAIIEEEVQPHLTKVLLPFIFADIMHFFL